MLHSGFVRMFRDLMLTGVHQLRKCLIVSFIKDRLGTITHTVWGVVPSEYFYVVQIVIWPVRACQNEKRGPLFTKEPSLLAINYLFQ